MKRKKNMQIRVRPETRDKLDKIAADRRWKLCTVIDELATERLNQMSRVGKSRDAATA